MANNIDLTISALECPLGTFQCSAWLILQFRTESAFQAAPVFRRAYWLTSHHPALRRAGVPPGLLAPPNAPASAASRPPSEHTVLFLPKRSCFRFASLSLRTPHRPPVSLCFSCRLIFRLRTESAFQAAPVFRMAYSAPTAHCAVSSETLMLQVRFALPPNPAPLSRFFSISRRSGLMAPLCKGSCPASSRTEGLPPD